MPKISIVMPLYNAEKYLEESLDCVFAQTFSDYELICVNDASSDGTMSILQKFQAKDTRLIILENDERSGAAYSRNKGMEVASGKYLMFLDGDDVFDEEMLGLSFREAEQKDADVLMFHYKHFPSEKIHNKERIVRGKNYIEKYCKNTFSIEQCEPYEFLLWSTGPCNKLFKRELIVENGIEFQNLPSSNDTYFVNMVLLLSKRISVLDDERVMLYVREHAEPSRISVKRNPLCNYQAYEQLLCMLIKAHRLDLVYRHFFYKVLFAFVFVLQNIKEKEEAETFYDFLQKEGIIKFQQISAMYSYQNDDYICYLLRQFSEPFESEWFKNETVLKSCLMAKKQEIATLFVANGENKQIAIWGAGINGKAVLRVCKEQQLPVKYVIDMDEKKQGTYIEKICVMKPEAVVDDIDTILVSVQGIAKEVESVVNRYTDKIKIVDINEYFAVC